MESKKVLHEVCTTIFERTPLSIPALFPTFIPLQDPRQLLTARRLQQVYEDVCTFVGLTPGEPSSPKGRGLTLVHAAEMAPVRRGWFSGLFGGDSTLDTQPARPPPVGLYMYGGVGVGKTMLMDLFASVSPPEFQVHRIHLFR